MRYSGTVMSGRHFNKPGQQQTGEHGCRRQPEINTGGISRCPPAVGCGVVVGASCSARGRRTVEPATADVTGIAATNVHMHVAELPEVVVLEEIRPTWNINTTEPNTTTMKKALRETQTLRAKNFRPAADPLRRGAGPPKFNQLGLSLPAPTDPVW